MGEEISCRNPQAEHDRPDGYRSGLDLDCAVLLAVALPARLFHLEELRQGSIGALVAGQTAHREAQKEQLRQVGWSKTETRGAEIR